MPDPDIEKIARETAEDIIIEYDRVEKAESELADLQRKIKEQCIMPLKLRSGNWTKCAVCQFAISAPEGVRNVTLGHASDCLVRDVMEEVQP